jgi:hypothetical protein
VIQKRLPFAWGYLPKSYELVRVNASRSPGKLFIMSAGRGTRRVLPRPAPKPFEIVIGHG